MNLQLYYSHPHKNPQLPVCLCLISLLGEMWGEEDYQVNFMIAIGEL